MNSTVLPRSWTPAIHAALRVMTGLLFMEHGTGKLLGFPALNLHGMSHGLLLLTGAMELFGGALIAIGLFTRPVAFLLSGFMAVAYFMAHFPMSFFPAVNFGEPAVLYCFIFLYFAATGAGTWSVDRAMTGTAPTPARLGEGTI